MWNKRYANDALLVVTVLHLALHLFLLAVLVLLLELLLLLLLLFCKTQFFTVVTSQVAKPSWRHWSGGSIGPGGNGARTDGCVFCTPPESKPGPEWSLTPLSNDKTGGGGRVWVGSLGDPFSAGSLFNYMWIPGDWGRATKLWRYFTEASLSLVVENCGHARGSFSRTVSETAAPHRHISHRTGFSCETNKLDKFYYN